MTSTPRRAGALLLCACVLLLAGCAAVQPRAGGASAQQTVLEVKPGVYLLRGSGGAPDADNLGRTGNAGFIVGPTGVVAIDTGTSYRHGVALLDAIRRVTDRPVRLALITHTRQEFLFGATAFRERGIPLHMHLKAAQLMASRCEGCLKTLRQTVGEDEMRGTAMFKPDATVEASQRIELIGRPLQLLYFGHSSGPGDIAVLDVESGVLFAGGLLDAAHIPDVIDARLDGWQRALTELQGQRITAIVPGHGPLASASLIGDVARYLTQLEARLKTLLDAGTALSDVPDAAALPEFADWEQYATIHRRNASVVFLRLEREQMLK